MVPFKKTKKSKSMEPKRDPMPRKVGGSAKRNRDGGVTRDPFSQTVTDTPPRMPRNVNGS
jgi:hypothetical protein